MEKEVKESCPLCHGKKTVEGVCQCSTEWRGTETDSGWEDCRCTPEQECPTCKGAGFLMQKKDS